MLCLIIWIEDEKEKHKAFHIMEVEKQNSGRKLWQTNFAQKTTWMSMKIPGVKLNVNTNFSLLTKQ